MKIVITCHGNVSEELIKSTEMIVGKTEYIYPISFLPGEGREDLLRKYEEVLGAEKDKVLFLCDIFGGSPFNAAFEYVYGNDADIITGVNLPMIIDILGIREDCSSPKEVYEKLNIEHYIRHIEEI